MDSIKETKNNYSGKRDEVLRRILGVRRIDNRRHDDYAYYKSYNKEH